MPIEDDSKIGNFVNDERMKFDIKLTLANLPPSIP